MDALLLMNVERISALTMVDTDEDLQGPSGRPERILSGFQVSLSRAHHKHSPSFFTMLIMMHSYSVSLREPFSVARPSLPACVRIKDVENACRQTTGLCTA